MRSHLFRFFLDLWRQPTRLTPQQLANRLGQVPPPLVLDVRTAEEFTSGHIAGALLLPLNELEQKLSVLALDRERPIVTV
jgi:rhodanese-related sulfurtransferase